MLTRRWIPAVFAAVMVAALWCLLMGSPALALDPGENVGVQTVAPVEQSASPAPTERPAPETSAQPQPATASTPPAAGTHPDAPTDVTQAAVTNDVPEGSPLGVQLATIAVLLLLGVAYFRLMSHSGRRAPVSRDGEQSDGA